MTQATATKVGETEKHTEPYHGPERRVGAERRKVQVPITPFQEFPKMVEGVVVDSAEDEAKVKKSAAKSEHAAEKQVEKAK